MLAEGAYHGHMKSARIGETKKGDKGDAVTNPAVRVYAKTTAQAKALLTEFGLTPSSRSRVKVEKDESDPADFSDLGGGGGKGA